jgi:tetratricopeptide (TPR) repeat protein
MDEAERLYYSLDEGERFCVRFLTYLERADERLLRDAMWRFGLDGDVVGNLWRKGILSFISSHELDIPTDLKKVAKGFISEDERYNTFVDVLLNVGTEEAILALSSNYKRMRREYRTRFINLVKSRIDRPFFLWIASEVSSFEDEFLTLSEKGIESFKERKERWLSSVLVNLGCAYGERGNAEKALGFFESAVKICQDEPKIWCNLGLCYKDLGRLGEGIWAYEEALNIRPDCGEAWWCLAWLYLRNGEPERALGCYEKAQELNPALVPDWFNLGLGFMEKGQIDRAIESYRRALDVNPEDGESLYNLGDLYREKGDIDRAIIVIKRFTLIRPGDVVGWHTLGLLYNLKNEIDKAVECYSKAHKIDPSYGEEWPSVERPYNEYRGKIEEIARYERLRFDPRDLIEGRERL